MQLQIAYGCCEPLVTMDGQAGGYYRFSWLRVEKRNMTGNAIKIFPGMIILQKLCVMTAKEIASG
jgi:hypothetical protein